MDIIQNLRCIIQDCLQKDKLLEDANRKQISDIVITLINVYDINRIQICRNMTKSMKRFKKTDQITKEKQLELLDSIEKCLIFLEDKIKNSAKLQKLHCRLPEYIQSNEIISINEPKNELIKTISNDQTIVSSISKKIDVKCDEDEPNIIKKSIKDKSNVSIPINKSNEDKPNIIERTIDNKPNSVINLHNQEKIQDNSFMMIVNDLKIDINFAGVFSKEIVAKIKAFTDTKIKEYNKLNVNHPMKGIKRSKDGRYYMFNDLRNEIYKPLPELVNIQKESHMAKTKNLNFFEEIRTEGFVIHKESFIMYYGQDKYRLFDIHQIISILNLDRCDVKYNQFKSDILFIFFDKNVYGGYYIRELINYSTLVKIIGSTNADFAKSFLTHIGLLMQTLTQYDGLIIRNDAIELDVPKLMETLPDSYEIKVVNTMRNNYDYVSKIANDAMQNIICETDTEIIKYAKTLIKAGSKITLSSYKNKNVMYIFILALKDNKNLNRIIIKIGYSEIITDRIMSLKQEYGCDIFLTHLKPIRGETIETHFHNTMRKIYPDMIYNEKINSKNKEELYILDERLINEFMALPEVNIVETIKNNNELTMQNINEPNYSNERLQIHKASLDYDALCLNYKIQLDIARLKHEEEMAKIETKRLKIASNERIQMAFIHSRK